MCTFGPDMGGSNRAVRDRVGAHHRKARLRFPVVGPLPATPSLKASLRDGREFTGDPVSDSCERR